MVVLGLTFKEDCPDLRNSKVIDVIRELQSYSVNVHVHDPVAEAAEAMHEYGVDIVPWGPAAACRSHCCGRSAQGIEGPFARRPCFQSWCPAGLYVDVKSQADAPALTARGVRVWRL